MATCHSDLQKLVSAVAEKVEITVLEGYRGKEAQDAAFAAGKSKLRFPNGKHNKQPSLAVDIAPYPVDWYDLKRFTDMAAVVKQTAAEMGIAIDWGGDWKFVDMPHFELA